GIAGGVQVVARDAIALSDGGAIKVSSDLTTGGTIKLSAGSSLALDNGAQIAASANVAGGNIDLTVPGSVSLFRSSITGRTQIGDGGHIIIDPKVVALAASTIDGK